MKVLRRLVQWFTPRRPNRACGTCRRAAQMDLGLVVPEGAGTMLEEDAVRICSAHHPWRWDK